MKNHWLYKGKPISEMTHLTKGAYGFVYLLSFPRGKFYIGQHVFNEDGLPKNRYYCGSGKRLLNYISKYGRKGVIREIVSIAKNKDELNRSEIEIISKSSAVKDDSYLNITPGGDGTGSGEENPMYGKRHTKEARKRIGDAHRGEKSHMYGRTGTKSSSNKYHGTFLYCIVDDNPYLEITTGGRNPKRLEQCFNVIKENPGIMFENYIEKCEILKNDARKALKMMIERKQVEMRDD